MIGTKPFTQIIYRHVFKKTLELHIPKWDLLPMLKYEQLKKLALLLYTSISNRNVRIKMIKIMFSKVSFLYSFQV
jgi:hypothetical protein